MAELLFTVLFWGWFWMDDELPTACAEATVREDWVPPKLQAGTATGYFAHPREAVNSPLTCWTRCSSLLQTTGPGYL